MSVSDPSRFFDASALRLEQISLVPLKAFVAYDVNLNAAASTEWLKAL